MTATAARGGRPSRPRPSLAVPIGLVAFAAITWASLSAEFGIGLDLGGIIADITRGAGILVSGDDNPAKKGLFVPNLEFVPRTFEPMLETLKMAVVASVIGCAVALPVAFLASRVTSPNTATYLADRSLLSVVRAIPDILYALVFVASVGIGPLAGIVALVFFNIGVVAKLLSETVDGIDAGPIEAARAGGATRTQTVRWSVLPAGAAELRRLLAVHLRAEHPRVDRHRRGGRRRHRQPALHAVPLLQLEQRVGRSWSSSLCS